MKQVGCRNTMAERHAAAPQAAVRGGDAGGLAAGDASRATGTSVATVTTSLAAVELCDEDVAMRCSAQSDADAGSAADPEWEAVLVQLLAEEAEDGHAAVQVVAGKVDESLERRDERACATGGGFSMPQAAPTSMGSWGVDGPLGATGVLLGGVPPIKGVWGGAPGGPPQAPIFSGFFD